MPLNLPPFEIDGELGHGASSVVYRARLHGVPCALKVPRSVGNWTRWIYREAVALARVRHPGLPVVLEVGEADRLPYLAMELIEGQTLADRLAAGPLPQLESLDIAARLLDALWSVHRAGLVHRDVKPRNIVIDPRRGIRLVDFGFATTIEHASDVSYGVGTRAYAAPEQFRAPARVDARADLYGVGSVLFECLTGELPAGDIDDEPTLVGLGHPLATLLRGLLASSADRRYPDAQAALADIDRVRRGDDVLGAARSTPTPAAPALIGRAFEVTRLRMALQSVNFRGGRVVLIGGVSGSGKSRLLTTAADIWRELHPTRAVSVPSRQGDAPMAVMRRVLETFVERDAEQAAAILRSVADRELAALARFIAPPLAEILPPADEGVGPAPSAFSESAAELVVRMARAGGPMLLLVDDLQWTDPASRDVLTRIAHRAADAPIALVLAGRNEGRGAATFERLETLDRIERIDPRPLGEADVAALVASHLAERRPDPLIVGHLATLADGTPLGILEVLRAYLDTGALRPRGGSWNFDVERAERVALPRGALACLARRTTELPKATRRVLDLAAVIGPTFEEELLARVVGIERVDLGYALADARRAGLCAIAEPGRHRFVHDSVRDMLLAELGPNERRAAHQRAAEAMEALGRTSFPDICAIAGHYAAGEGGKSPARAYATARAAAEGALARFDNETALHFLALAKEAAEAGAIPLDTTFFHSVGEGRLRLASFDESLAAFEVALARATDGHTRARVLGRMAWVHHAAADSERAWTSLRRAFEALGTRMPVESVATVGEAALAAARLSVGKFARRRLPRPAKEIALLCDLHYQNFRLGFECGHVVRALQSIVQARELSLHLGPSTEQSRSRSMFGIMLSATAGPAAASGEFDVAQEMANAIGDPAMTAFSVQHRALGACFAGQFGDALRLFHECLDRYGHWLELSEYCQNAVNIDFIEALRGRPEMASVVIEQALARLRRAGSPTTILGDYFAHRVRANHASLGRNGLEPDAWLRTHLERIPADSCRATSGQGLVFWGARARWLLEERELGAEFDVLVDRFAAEGHNPRTAHPLLAEYYIAVAHARVEQVLAAGVAERPRLLPRLRQALADLRACAKLPLFKAHRMLIEAWAAWFDGSVKAAREWLAKAEAAASDETCPWVLSGVARLRAWILLGENKPEAARDQARIAESLARDHGANARARLLRKEFGLPEPQVTVATAVRSRSSSSLRHAKKQLASLLAIARAGVRDLRPEPQAVSILDEILRDFDADRATLLFRPEKGPAGELVIGRNREGKNFFGAEGWRETLLRRLVEGIILRSDPDAPEAQGDGRPSDGSRVLALPLYLHDRTAGALCLERGPSSPEFGEDASDLLGALSHQIPLAMELARLLGEREALQASLQHAQKMEAVGRLAGCVAHDFNNMLAAITMSLESLAMEFPASADVSEDFDIISTAVEQARQLTRQLLTFSRHKPVKHEPLAVNEVIAGLEPMVKVLVGVSTNVTTRLGPEAGAVLADRGALQQAVVNLCINSRDAMPNGGKLQIETALERVVTATPGGLAPGIYALISVSDTGEGIPPEIIDRIFEPFFSTKGEGRGTGLGLSTIHAFATNAGGRVEVQSHVGRGTTFRIYLPQLPPEQREAEDESYAPAVNPSTILVVDDEVKVTRALSHALERAGHRVLVANSGSEALALVRAHAADIRVALVDVRMPEMSGPELGARLDEIGVPFKVLYMTGFSPEAVPTAGGAVLEKPFSNSLLLRRIDQALLGSALA